MSHPKIPAQLARASHLAALFSAIALGITAATAGPITYSDNFEGNTINPFWTITQQLGTVSLSTAQFHSPTHSAGFSSVGGGQRDIRLTHTFGSAVIGDVSIYYYDTAPGQETLYQFLRLTTDEGPNGQLYIGTQDFDAFCYTAAAGILGPNASCGIFPQYLTTNVPRTLGWHLLDINVQPGNVSFSIDNTQVFTTSGNYTFNTIDFGESGPGFRPANVTAYFDDFSFVGSTAAVPEPSSLLLCGIAGLALLGSYRKQKTIRRKTSSPGSQ
jgi:hypothetical protein